LVAGADFVAALQALSHLNRESADPEFILPLSQRVAMPRYSAMTLLNAGLMSEAICHLDIV